VISKLQFTLNNTVQKSTGFSPLYLVTGQEISSPDITVLTNSILPTLATGQNLETIVICITRLENAILQVQAPVAAGQGRQIRQCRPRNLFEKNTI
jgi:hypothetical protein